MKASQAVSLCAAAVLCFATVYAVPLPSQRDKPYEGYQVLSVEPLREEHIVILSELNKVVGVDFWSFRPNVLEKNVFSVSPDFVKQVTASLQDDGMKVEVLIPDLQVSIDRETQEQNDTSRFITDDAKSATFTRYMRYQEIEQYALDLQKAYPGRVSVESLGQTVEGRELWVIKVSSQLVPLKGQKNPAIFVDAGIHAREWIAPAVAVYLLSQLVENPKVSAELLSGLDWYIVPVLNPDGYEYTHTNERMWRKNMKKNGKCTGVDLNRNFGFHWNENGASSNPCAETYSGPEAQSEPESQILAKFLLNHKEEISTYLTFHSYGNYILYPWGYQAELPEDWKELDKIAQEVNKAFVAAGSNPYTIGSSTNVLYPAAGGSDDWAKGVAGIQKSYTIELPGGGSQGFDMPPKNIEKTVTQVLEGIKIFGKYAKNG